LAMRCFAPFGTSTYPPVGTTDSTSSRMQVAVPWTTTQCSERCACVWYDIRRCGSTWMRLTLNPSLSSRTCQETQGRSSLSRDTAPCWIMHPLRSAGPHSEVGSGHCDRCDEGPHTVRDNWCFMSGADRGMRFSAQVGPNVEADLGVDNDLLGHG